MNQRVCALLSLVCPAAAQLAEATHYQACSGRAARISDCTAVACSTNLPGGQGGTGAHPGQL